MKFAIRGAAIAILAPLALLSPPVSATTVFEEEFTCPIGGEKFKANVVGSTSTFGQRADGRPYGGVAIWPIPECPENGLPLFEDEFDPVELAALEIAIATPDFRAMRENDTSRYRLFWLKREIGRPFSEQVGALYQATWQTDDNWDRRNRYRSEFVNLAMRWDKPEGAEVRERDNWFWIQMRAVNAMRELGYYEEGLSRLAVVMQLENLPADEEAAENAKFYGEQIRRLLTEENPYPEPTNLTPARVAMFRCVAGSDLTTVERERCDGTAIQDEIASFEFRPRGGGKLQGEDAIRAANIEWRTPSSNE
ncbi:hypothetical protein [uncultured Erythrobacter sp.]|uniref:hypothetical protein n=1 Tax=uncultured Erythrobacter sp. TaxID=263913 RepID=UPI00262CF5E7|nr:hypothetical protein [uncultured Erythrobacter sp.]